MERNVIYVPFLAHEDMLQYTKNERTYLQWTFG